MSAIQAAIQRCTNDGWYAKLREKAPYWLGYFPVDPPEIQAELARCAMSPNENDVPRLRALLAVWQFPTWGQDSALPELGYPHVRLALLRLTRLLWQNAQRLSALHRGHKHSAINRTLTALARQAGLVERPRQGRRKRLPKPEHLRDLERQTVWLVSQVNEWSSQTEAFVAETQRLAEEEAERLAAEAKRIAEEAKRRAGEGERLAATIRADAAKMAERIAGTETAEVHANMAKMDELAMIDLRAEHEERVAARSAELEAYYAKHPQPEPVLVPEEDIAQVADRRARTVSLDDAWAIRFPMLTIDERRALVSREYQREGRKYSVADWLIARRLKFNATAIRKERAKATATDDRQNMSGHRVDSS